MTITKSISITVDRAHLEEVSGAILHAVLFQRVLGNLSAKELAVLDVAVPAIDNGSIEGVVVKHAKEVSSTASDRATLALVLSENKLRKVNHWFGFGEQEHTEQIPWECWIINFNVLTSKSENHKQIIYHNTQSDLRKALLQIVQFTDEHKEHIPPIMTADLSPFPFHILVNPPPIPPPNRSNSPRSNAAAAASRALTGEKEKGKEKPNDQAQAHHNSYFTAPLHSIARRITRDTNEQE
ncbi:hypothetical protein E3P99_02309 [Wallemia hederae]|uniref:Autophagy-related protein 101 n=1 Tax=Wallemia hederae TaxID=1540922 RepID=A0A4V4LT60_9BASI|nr:hypothetical protein E3P99_02309 [Wallemia hederae]